MYGKLTYISRKSLLKVLGKNPVLSRCQIIFLVAIVQLSVTTYLEVAKKFLCSDRCQAFENCSSNWDSPLTLNVSFNQIQNLDSTPVDDKRRAPPPFIRILDASHNELTSLPKNFLETLSPALLSLDLSYNRITEIDNAAFKRLSRLQELKLSHNQVLSSSNLLQI